MRRTGPATMTGAGGWRRLERPVAIACVTLQLAAAAALVLVLQADRAAGAFPGSSLVADTASAAGTAATLAIGLFIVIRRPGNVTGWLLVLFNLGWAVNNLAAAWVEYSATVAPLPSVPLAVWLTTWPSGSSLPMFALLILLFPDGRAASPRWRRFGRVVLAWAVILSLILAFAPGPTQALALHGLSIGNPMGLGGTAGSILAGFADPTPLVNIVLVALAAISAVLRFRRSTGLERQQLKWLACAVTVTIVAWLVDAAIMAAYPTMAHAPGWARAWNIAMADVDVLLPIAIGIAVLRYRLYEIDRIISRTVSYAILTALLATIYAAGLLGLQGILAPFTGGGGPAAVAASTLVVFALFAPARRRIQHLVDRRFNRARYDAEREIQRFAAHIRDEVDLALLGAELEAVAERTLLPARVGIWLRSGSGR
jgi:hypothetical protein